MLHQIPEQVYTGYCSLSASDTFFGSLVHFPQKACSCRASRPSHSSLSSYCPDSYPFLFPGTGGSDSRNSSHHNDEERKDPRGLDREQSPKLLYGRPYPSCPKRINRSRLGLWHLPIASTPLDHARLPSTRNVANLSLRDYTEVASYTPFVRCRSQDVRASLGLSTRHDNMNKGD